MIRIEYDDSRPVNPKDKEVHPKCTRKDRALGFYAILPDGSERKLPVGFMKISEMKKLEDFINSLHQ